MTEQRNAPPVDLDLDDIQGNIVPGFNKDHQAFVFIEMSDGDCARAWLAELQHEVASAYEVNGFRMAFRSIRRRQPDRAEPPPLRTTWLNVAISFEGLRLLRGARDVMPFSAEFRSGRVPGAEPMRNGGQIHAVLLLAADSAQDLDAELGRQLARINERKMTAFKLLRGNTLPGDLRGHEHFGFKDAVSQPLIAGLSCGSPPAIAAGEFVLGLRDESGSISGKHLPAWTRNGSFVAFLQLQQHVEVFWRAMRQHAQVFGVCPQELASRVIGRKRDAVGTPLSDPPSRYSHIGRAYSRWLGPSESSRHRILRRGIPYGAPWKEGEPDDGQRGMLFVAYQSDIARQFEYVWTRWLNGADHPTAGAGRDGLTGQSVQPDRATPVPMWSSRSLRPVSVESPTHGRVSVPIALPVFVTPQSSGYFFAPSISGLCVLAETAAGKGTNQHVKGPA